MNEQDQAAAYAAADWSESHGKIPGYFRERFSHFANGHLLDLGCGTADVTIRFVKAYPGVTALGVDGSEAMLAFGQRYVREAGLESRISLEQRYLPAPSLERGLLMQSSPTVCSIISPIPWSYGALRANVPNRALR